MPRATETDHSGSVTTGGIAQDVYSEDDAPFNGIFFQNTSDTDMRIEFGGTASSTKGRLIPANGAAYESPVGLVPAGALSVYCASGNKTFVCKTW